MVRCISTGLGGAIAGGGGIKATEQQGDWA